METRASWERALKANVLRYPSEAVVRWLAGASQRVAKGCDALDVGFGSGQHLQLFMDKGFRANGTELLDTALDIGRQVLGTSPLAGRLIKGDLDHPDLKDSSFHLVVAWGSVFLKPRDGIEWNLRQLHRLCAPQGEVCLNFRSRDNWFCGLGEEIAPGFFRLDKRAADYSNYEYTFVDADEARDLCRNAGFEIVNMERVELWKDNMEKRHSWFVVWLRK